MNPPKLEPQVGAKKSSHKSYADKVVIALASVSALVLFGMLFLRTSGEYGLQNLDPIGQLATPGVVRRRHARTLNWRDVQGEAPLYLRDIVYVPKDTYAEVVFGKNKKVRLEPDSMVQFDDITLDHILITLFDGKAEGDVIVRKQTAPAPVVPRTDYPKRLGQLPGSQGDEAANKLAALTVEKEQLDRELFSVLENVSAQDLGEWRVVTRKEEVINPLADRSLTLVHPKRAAYNLKANRWLNMEWDPVDIPGVVYQVEIAQNKNFVGAVQHKTQRVSLSVQLERPATYYWRVKAIKGVAESRAAVGQFQMVRVGGLGNVRESRLVASETAEFVAEVSRDPEFEEILATALVPKKNCKTAGLARGKYFCRIRSAADPKTLATYPFEVK